MKICENGIVREATDEEMKVLEESVTEPSVEEQIESKKGNWKHMIT